MILYFYYFTFEIRENFLNFILTLYICFYARHSRYMHAHSLERGNRIRTKNLVTESKNCEFGFDLATQSIVFSKLFSKNAMDE